MKKILLLYWYVPENWYPVYDLHIKNLRYYSNRFDQVNLVLASDSGCPKELIRATEEKLAALFPQGMNVTYTDNDPDQREAKYFREEVALKLDQLDQEATYFFCHNKGVASHYVSRDVLETWINFMYFANLYKIQDIENYLDKPETCTIGTYTWPNYYGLHMRFVKYKWHYSGTFFWFVPSRLVEHMNQTHEPVPAGSKYFAEGFPGSVLPYNSGKAIHLYGTLSESAGYSKFVTRTVPVEDQEAFNRVVANL